MRTNRIMKCYRFNAEVLKDLKKIVEKINISETSFIEIAIIEKMNRIKDKLDDSNIYRIY